MKICNILLMVILSVTSNPAPDDLSRRLCLLSGQYYHPGSDSCSDPFDEESCEPGWSWLLPTSVPGEVQCQDISDDLLNCAIPGINGEGEPYCFMESETAFDQPEEQILNRPANCTENKILMPAIFMENTKPCPRNFTCSADYKTAYRFISKHGKNGQIDLKQKELDYANDALACSGGHDHPSEPKMGCVPDTGSLADNSVLQDSYKLPKLICRDNPCPSGKWPWLTEDGYQRCLDADTEKIQNCPRNQDVREFEGTLQCQYFVSFCASCGFAKLCPRGKRFRRGRCRNSFFG